MKMYMKLSSVLIAGLMLMQTAFILPVSGDDGESQKSSIPDEAASTYASYSKYMELYGNKAKIQDEIIVYAEDFKQVDSSKLRDAPDGADSNKVYYNSEEDTFSVPFSVSTEGLYNVAVGYYTTEGKASSIERNILINNEIPFNEFRNVTFPRIWTGDDILTDSNQNEYRSTASEAVYLNEVTVSNDTIAPYSVYLQNGENTITLVSIQEPMLISYIKFYNKADTLRYDEYIKQFETYRNNEVEEIKIEGEASAYKSESWLYAQNDRTSPITSPTDPVKIKLNTIGGNNWRQSGQWIKWNFEVKKNGLYKLSLREKQNYSEGSYSGRNIYIDDEIPFVEFQDVGFKYQNNWNLKTIGGNEPYLIYLKAGVHTITLENTVGDMGEVVDLLDQSLTQLNEIYTQIVMLIGTDPDVNRDYKIDKSLPQTVTVFEKNIELLSNAMDALYKVTGSKGEGYGTIERLVIQLNGFLNKMSSVPSCLDTFRTNISALSSFLLTAKEQPLLLDYILFSPSNQETPAGEASFLSCAAYQIKVFFMSFFTDYNQVVGTSKNVTSKSINLWLGSSGRDQATAIKGLINNYFTPTYGINVSVKLVDMSILLPAVATGNGPDVAIGQDRTMPLNYAFRGALTNLAEFEDCDDVLSRFCDEASVSFRYEDKLYALPETFTFSMLFYRTDILEKLNIDIPETWDDLYEILPLLNNSNLQVGFPSISTTDITWSFS